MVERVGRVFAAAPLPAEARLALADRLSDWALPGKVVPPENWHLTLRFLGSVDDVTYERFLACLDSAELGPPFRIGLSGLGAFPNAVRATVLWAGLATGGDGLTGLAGIAEDAARAAGLDQEDRPFRPHMTLSRVRPQEDVRALVEGVGELGVGWRCEEIVVFNSHSGRGGVWYEPLETFALRR